MKLYLKLSVFLVTVFSSIQISCASVSDDSFNSQSLDIVKVRGRSLSVPEQSKDKQIYLNQNALMELHGSNVSDDTNHDRLNTSTNSEGDSIHLGVPNTQHTQDIVIEVSRSNLINDANLLPMSSYFHNMHSFWLVSVGWFELGARITKTSAPFLYLAASSSYFDEYKFGIEIAGSIVGFSAPLLRKLADYGNQVIIDRQQKKTGITIMKYNELSAEDKKILKDSTNTLRGKYFYYLFQIWHMSSGILNFVNLINSWLAPTLSTLALGDFVSSTSKKNLQISSMVIGYCSLIIEDISRYQPEAEKRVINNLKIARDYAEDL